MNICFIFGEIISKVEFNFILNSKNISMARFDIILSNKSIVKTKAYNELADYCYRELKIKDKIYICGKLEDNEIKIEFLYLF